jgi:hypothetical protein
MRIPVVDPVQRTLAVPFSRSLRDSGPMFFADGHEAISRVIQACSKSTRSYIEE